MNFLSMFLKHHKVEPLPPEEIQVDLFPACDFCRQQYPANHVLYQASRWYGKTQIGPEANMCQPHKEAYGVPGRCQKIVLRDKEVTRK